MNNGLHDFSACLIVSVYKRGFATTQEAYEENVYPLFKSLDRLEEILKHKRYLVRDVLTEAGRINHDAFC